MDEILKKLLDAINDAYDKTEGYIVYDLLKACALVMADYDIKLEKIQRLFDVDNMTGSTLETYVYQRKGIERNEATYAVGTLTVTGSGTVNEGDLFETASGVQFKAIETKTIDGTGSISIQAVVAGSIGNVPANHITQIPVTLSGITSVANPQPTYDGFEAESDDSLRDRYYIAVRTPATSANVYHYLQWTKETAGVGDAKIFSLEQGDNTVEIVIINADKQPASQTLVDTVQEYIDPNSEGLGNGQAAIGAFCYVLAATGVPINVSVNIVKDSNYTDEQVQTNIEYNIIEYLKNIAFKQSYVSYAAISNAIFDAEGVQDFSTLSVNGGTSNILIGDKEVATLGDVVIA
ncbi:baseplate J/gp47 family protein [Marinicrinis sediminis]|uniref:Baseplate J/gp47 family protein n=1 Tax=Marinicrinis sediminis TaxID=1652465 RepID=A0ABW5R9S7_9BACL